MRSRKRLGDVCSRAEAGVNEAPLAKLVERVLVQVRTLRLHHRRLVPLKPQPAQVFEDAVDELGPAAAGVEILDPEAKAAAARPGMGMTKRGREGMAEMQPSRRRGSETCDLQDSLHDKAVPGDS